MKLINFSGPIFIAMWLTIFHYKDYKIGYSATNKKNQRKSKGLFRRITINAKSISKYLRKNWENSNLRVLVQWVEKYPFLEISTKFGQKKVLEFFHDFFFNYTWWHLTFRLDNKFRVSITLRFLFVQKTWMACSKASFKSHISNFLIQLWNFQLRKLNLMI